MISPNSNSLPPSPAAHDLSAVLHLIALVTDPVATKERMEQLAAADATARKSVDAANTASSELDAKRIAHEAELAAASDAHGAALRKSQSEFEAQCASRDQELMQRAAALDEREKQLRSEIDRVAGLSADLQRRLDHLRAAGVQV